MHTCRHACARVYTLKMIITQDTRKKRIRRLRVYEMTGWIKRDPACRTVPKNRLPRILVDVGVEKACIHWLRVFEDGAACIADSGWWCGHNSICVKIKGLHYGCFAESMIVCMAAIGMEIGQSLCDRLCDLIHKQTPNPLIVHTCYRLYATGFGENWLRLAKTVKYVTRRLPPPLIHGHRCPVQVLRNSSNSDGGGFVYRHSRRYYQQTQTRTIRSLQSPPLPQYSDNRLCCFHNRT